MQLRAQMEKKLPNMFTPYRKNVEKYMEKLKSTGNPSAIVYQQEIEPVIKSFPFDSKFLHKNPEICEKAGFQNIDEIAVSLQIAFDAPNTAKNFINPKTGPANFFDDKTMKLIDSYPDSDPNSHILYPYTGGETAGLRRIHDFVWRTKSVGDYKNTRNRCIGNFYSSKFSLWLAHGCISARQIVHETAKYEKEHGSNISTYWLIFEMLWRDFTLLASLQSKEKLFDYGGVQNKPEKWTSGKFIVKNKEADFKAWCEGKTGFPFVDANMRELVETGWMSNRGRQNVASFLVYKLGIDWRWGGEFFEHHLVDHNVGANYVNWQTIAGIGWQGRDNVFNVVKQSIQYEPEVDFIVKWCPELIDCPKAYISLKT